MLIQCSLWKYNKFGEESDLEWSNWESLKEVWIKCEQEWWDVHFLFSKNTEAEIIRTCIWHEDRTWGCPLGRFKKWMHSSIGRTSYQELASYERSWKPHRILIPVFKKCNKWYFKISLLVSWWPFPPGLPFHLPHSCLTNYSVPPFLIWLRSRLFTVWWFGDYIKC